MKKLIVLMLILLWALPLVHSENYYVRVDGQDINDGLSYETAWKTISHAAQNVESNSVVHVYEGVYNEDTSGLGYLYISNSASNIEYISDGTVTIRSNPGSYRILHFQTPAKIKFKGFIFDGQDSNQNGITSNYGDKIIEGNSFFNLVSKGIYFSSGDRVNITWNSFGSESNLLVSEGVHLANSDKSLVENNTFFVNGKNVITLERGDETNIIGNNFGSSQVPIDLIDGWAIRTYDSDDTLIERNNLYLLDGFGIGVFNNVENVNSPKILNNSFFHSILTARYSVIVGSETPKEFELNNPEIAANSLFIPVGSSSKHNIFVGHSNYPLIHDNYVYGGGYGIIVKGDNNALISNNQVYNNSMQAFLDKGSNNSLFINNIANCRYGKCARVTNNDPAQEVVMNSTWRENDFYVQGTQLAFEFSYPVNPITNNVISDQNNYHVDYLEKDLAVIISQYLNLFELQDIYEIELNSNLFIDSQNPDIFDIETFSIGTTSAKIKFYTTESTKSRVLYGIEDITQETEESEYGMAHEVELLNLIPGTQYIFQAVVCDNINSCKSSEILSFNTKKSGKPHQYIPSYGHVLE